MITDNRETIHNILGTPSQFRGDDTDQTKTASEAVMIKNQASGRQDKIVRAIESSMHKYFRFLTQMITVWYDDKHYATVNGGDGNFDYIEMHKSKVESGMTVRVQTGTTLPFDKQRQENIAAQAGELGIISPYDYYKLMHMDNPQKLYDNFMKWKSDPQSLAMDISSDEANRQAVVDFTELMAGDKVKVRDNPTPDYIEQMRKLMISDEFLKAKPKIQKAVLDFVQKSALSLQVRTALEQDSGTEDVNPPAPQPPQQPPMPGQPMPPQPMQPPVGAPVAPQPMGQPLPAPQLPPAPAPITPAQPMPQSPIQGIMQNRV